MRPNNNNINNNNICKAQWQCIIMSKSEIPTVGVKVLVDYAHVESV